MNLGEAPPRALYVHYPFCVHRCHYCDFSVTRSSEPPADEWLRAIETELDWWFERGGWTAPVPLASIFVGGGTPSLLEGGGPAELADLLRSRFTTDAADFEWTAEANPASLTPEVAGAWRAAGANRVSIGVQALDDGVLRWLGRLHDRAGAERAVATARSAGFRSISVDLLFGLPSAVRRDLDAEIDTALELGIDHVSAYGLTIEPRTPLARRVELGRVVPASGRAYGGEYRRLSSRLAAAGMTHYEVSSYGRPGHECRHNWYYWNRSPYLGLGPSSHGFFPPIRIWNVFRWDRYRERIREGAGPVEGREELGAADEALERLWLGLRTREGLDTADPAWDGPLERRLGGWLEAGWLERRGDRVVATTEGWLRLDELVAELGGDPGFGVASRVETGTEGERAGTRDGC